MSAAPERLADLEALFPDAAIEEVGDRREVVIYTGLSVTPDGRLVQMPEDL